MTLVNNTVNMEQVKRYVDKKEYGKPILLRDVVLYFNTDNDNFVEMRKTISQYLNRLVNYKELQKFVDGVFYKTKQNVFGETQIDVMELIRDVYLFDNEAKSIIGYRVGAMVLANIGIANNLENKYEIVTNNYNKKKVLDKIKLNVQLKKPLVEVNNDNYRYLQLLDTVKNLEKYHLVSDQAGKKLTDYMNKNKIKTDKLFNLAKEYYTRKTINNLLDLLAMN